MLLTKSFLCLTTNTIRNYYMYVKGYFICTRVLALVTENRSDFFSSKNYFKLKLDVSKKKKKKRAFEVLLKYCKKNIISCVYYCRLTAPDSAGISLSRARFDSRHRHVAEQWSPIQGRWFSPIFCTI